MLKALFSISRNDVRRGGVSLAKNLRETRSASEIEALLKRTPFDVQNDRV